MVPKSVNDLIVCVVGLGYVGEPLAEAFSRHLLTCGYDIDSRKVDQILASGSSIHATGNPVTIRDVDVVIMCVPTPVTSAKDPDLRPVISAATTVGRNIKPGAVVVLESTVFPGATEEVVIPILQQESGMVCGKDFYVGYSPERINPHDEEHTLDKIVKIVAGMDEKTTDFLVGLYGLVTTVYRAPSIRVAEAAKVIENIQRDLNIALMNELSLIFHRMGLDTKEVLDAAATKWNFHRYTPGLVGGHCIPVDPYYLVMKAEELGYHPQVILAGRAINDSMPGHVARLTIMGLNEAGKVIKGSRVLIMGLTYKEDVPDIRESPVIEIIRELNEFQVRVYGYDPLLSEEVIRRMGLEPVLQLEKGGFDSVIIAVPHQQFKEMDAGNILGLMGEHPVLVDVKGIIDRNHAMIAGIYYQRL